jgi:hypothetical protein
MLLLLEVLEHVLRSPTFVPKCLPGAIVGIATGNVNRGVRGARATETTAPRPSYNGVVRIWLFHCQSISIFVVMRVKQIRVPCMSYLGYCLMIPVISWVSHLSDGHRRYHNHWISDIGRTCFKDADMSCWVFGQSSCNNEACCSTTYDDEVIIVLEKLLKNGTECWEIECAHGAPGEVV